jgi:FlaA1/EpsC-like NDP-sugar epimerase
MVREREHTVVGILRACDMLVLAMSFPVAYLVRDRVFGERLGQPGLYPIVRYWSLLVWTLLLWVIAAWVTQLYHAQRLRSIADEVYRVGRALVLVAAAMAAIAFLTQEKASARYLSFQVSRLFVVFYFVTSMGLLFVNRLLFRSALTALRRHGFTTRILAVVGTTEVAREVAEGIMARDEWGYHFAGYIEEEESDGPRRVGPVIGSLDQLQKILDNKILDEIIFAVSHERLEDIEAAVLLCRGQGVTARICLGFAPRRIVKLSLEELNGVPTIGVY